MNIGITISKSAYTPEAYAYEKYLKNLGHHVQLDYELDPNNDVNIYFMGTRPFWKKAECRAIEIHEYHSLSIPPYAKLKDFSKKIINRKPGGRIFLNNFVHQALSFPDNIPYIYRDMGVDEAFFQKPSENPIYDIIYCGSISGRKGLVEILLKLSQNYKIIVVGRASKQEQELLQVKNITLTGVVSREALPEIYRNCRYGLNYTPDIYPFNAQTSTKTLEYLASGLGVISNKYFWSEYISNEIGKDFIWLDKLMLDEKEVKVLNKFSNEFDVNNYSWHRILEKCKFNDFLLGL